MPPPAVKTIRDLIYWQYAKIISESAGFGKRQYGFVMNRFKEMLKERNYSNKAIKHILKWYCDDETEKVKVCEN